MVVARKRGADVDDSGIPAKRLREEAHGTVGDYWTSAVLYDRNQVLLLRLLLVS